MQQWNANLRNFKASSGQAPIDDANQFYAGPNDQPQFDALGNIYKAGAASDGGLSYPLTHVGGELAEAAAAASGAGGPLTMAIGAGSDLLKLPIKGAANAYKRANLAQALRQGSAPLTGQAVGQAMPFDVGGGLVNLGLSQGSQYGY